MQETYVVHCPTEDDARVIFEFWVAQGVVWNDGRKITVGDERGARQYGSEACFTNRNGRLLMSTLSSEKRAPEGPIYTVDEIVLGVEDITPFDESELMAMLTAAGL